VLQLTGVLHLSKGTCDGDKPGGSYLSVTFGTKVIGNPASSCEHGAVTLLSPGRPGLSTDAFTPLSDEAFDSRGNPVATSLTQPVRFGSHLLSLVSSGQDLQDAPTGRATFAFPHLYVTGTKVLADVRSIQALYDGAAGTTCASGAGSGCWLIGAERATGTYDAQTHRVTLSWFSGQSFVQESAGTVVHLSGVFVGAKPKPLKRGTAVDLGTSSFAAGPAPRSNARTMAARHRRGSTRTGAQQATASARAATTAASSGNRRLAAILAAAMLLVLAASHGAALRKGRS
jgi:hypothetical protein